MKNGFNFKSGKILAALLIVVFLSAEIMPVFALNTETTPAIIVSSTICEPGEIASITVDLKNNPGIVSMTLRVLYDDKILTLTEVNDAGILGDTSHKPEFADPYTLVWVNDTSTTNYTVNGTIVTLVFAVADTAENGAVLPVEIEYNYDNYDIYDKDANKVKFEVEQGSVVVKKSVINDISDFIYTTSGSNLTIVGYKGNANDVIIGSTYIINNVEYTVEKIDFEAFLGQKTITSVVIPQTVTTIGEAAFYDCTSLTHVTILNKDVAIGDVALGYYYASRKEHIVEGFTIKGYAGSTAEKYAEVDARITFETIIDVLEFVPGSKYQLNEDSLYVIVKSSSKSGENLENFMTNIATDHSRLAIINEAGEVQNNVKKFNTGYSVQLLDVDGSVTKTYAIVILGDTDHNGRFSISDVSGIKSAIASKPAKDTIDFIEANVDSNSRLTISDASALQSFLAHGTW